jgi:hypothetical protein
LGARDPGNGNLSRLFTGSFRFAGERAVRDGVSGVGFVFVLEAPPVI